MGKKKLTNEKTSVLYAIIMWALAILCVYPFIMMVLISFRNQGDIYMPLFSKARMTVANYGLVLKTRYFGNWYWNSFRTVAVSIIFRLLVTIPASYAFSRMKFRGRSLILGILVATMMVPAEATMVSRYLYFKQLGILNSSLSIVLPEIAEVFYLVILIEFFRSIPESLLEAAKIDGASHLSIIIRVFIPLSGPALATVVLFSFINIWNNFVDPFLFINNTSRQLLTPALRFFQSSGGANVPMQLAGASLSVVPIIVLFVFTQKFFVAGISSSGIKG
ncbi:MAG: carbohydrate ABC transporter permease [Spirochaetales bacterium]|nr:carbohydrate ABC transporter permease [Spirochaetales bacterium]MBQ4501423.1 carbohydrate ABC transporter permease [Spirochaetales bacterium]MBQ7282405.1 carbohydrate ABC transporter permease [Spirochaetales bacterium]